MSNNYIIGNLGENVPTISVYFLIIYKKIILSNNSKIY